MRTIIPFPVFRVLSSNERASSGALLPEALDFRGVDPTDGGTRAPVIELPEGEVSAAHLPSPSREPDIHSNIVALIQAVHVRFG